MEAMEIAPTTFTYNQLILNFAKTKNMDMVMSLMKEMESKYDILPCKYTYNNMILCYAKMNEPNSAYSVIREMNDKGIQPDIVSFTTLIDAFNRTGNFDKCWEIYNDVYQMQLSGDIDEFLLSYMVRLTAKTHESEKALKIF